MGLFKGVFGKQTFSTSTSRATARAAKMEARVEGLRKGTMLSRDAQIRGPSQTASARDYLTKSLGKAPGAQRATSIGRLTGSGSTSLGSGPSTALPPKLPPSRPL
jgi:hypothetical protein